MKHLKMDRFPQLYLDCRPEPSEGLGCTHHQPALLVSLVSFIKHHMDQLTHDQITSSYSVPVINITHAGSRSRVLTDHTGRLTKPSHQNCTSHLAIYLL